jgi:hypothetical protein
LLVADHASDDMQELHLGTTRGLNCHLRTLGRNGEHHSKYLGLIAPDREERVERRPEECRAIDRGSRMQLRERICDSIPTFGPDRSEKALLVGEMSVSGPPGHIRSSTHLSEGDLLGTALIE